MPLIFVRSADLNDHCAIQRFAVSQAFAVNLADNERRRLTEEMWQHCIYAATNCCARVVGPRRNECTRGMAWLRALEVNDTRPYDTQRALEATRNFRAPPLRLVRSFDYRRLVDRNEGVLVQ